MSDNIIGNKIRSGWWNRPVKKGINDESLSWRRNWPGATNESSKWSSRNQNNYYRVKGCGKSVFDAPTMQKKYSRIKYKELQDSITEIYNFFSLCSMRPLWLIQIPIQSSYSNFFPLSFSNASTYR